MAKEKLYGYRIVVTAIGENFAVGTYVQSEGLTPKTYSEIIEVLKGAIQIYEEKKIIHGDNLCQASIPGA